VIDLLFHSDNTLDRTTFPYAIKSAILPAFPPEKDDQEFPRWGGPTV